jgi:hypothetical protein
LADEFNSDRLMQFAAMADHHSCDQADSHFTEFAATDTVT